MLDSIRSKYVLKQIFANCKVNVCLKLILHNKKYQKRLNISIIDSILAYNIIKIEITPVSVLDTPFIDRFPFINIKNDRSNYHIFFNDSKEPINRDYFRKEDKVSKITVFIDRKIKTLKELFKDCIYIKEVKVTNCIRDTIYNTSKMFYGCKSLVKADISKLNTRNVNNMGWMFYFCSSLEEVIISNLNTLNATNMEYMFAWCVSLKELNLSNLDTKNVINMESMFSDCSSLSYLNILNFNLSSVINMKYMFENCKSLNNLVVSDFIIDNKSETQYMFSNCKIETINMIYNLNKNLVNFKNLQL